MAGHSHDRFPEGCPLQCWWCHNPEGMSGEPEIVVAEGRCTQCGRCRQACPLHDAGPAAASGAARRRPTCLRCGACVEACPMQARQILGRRITVSEVVAEVCKDQIFYDDSQGGATFSGGEPFAQAAFLLELLRACGHRNPYRGRYHGLRRPEALLTAARWTDLFLYDIKILDDARHRRYTGVSNAMILDNSRSSAGSMATSGSACRSCRA